MQPAARVNDAHVCPKDAHKGGPILKGAATVQIGNEDAARVGDACKCDGEPDAIAKGSTTVQIEKQPAARMGDPTLHGGVITSGFAKVFIGG